MISPKAKAFLYRSLNLTRILAMMVLLAFVGQLVVWNRHTDPRFYRFLGTPPGRLLSGIMNWPNLHLHRPRDKDEADYTDEELIWKRKLEAQLNASWPTHVLTLRDGTEEYVRIEGRTREGLRVQEHFGGKGRLERFIPHALIEKERPYTAPKPTVTWRDVQFQMEYPDFQLMYFGHYTVLSDAPYFQIASSVKALEEIRDQYMDLFGELVRFPKPDQGLQVLFFSNETQYRQHQESSAPHLASSAGYYSPMEDRMVVFNQFHSDRARDVRDDVRSKIDHMLEDARTEEDRRRILRMQSSVDQQIRAQGKLETIATLRHEGVHHLAYTHGVHSWIHAENAWLIEGKAVYFEPESPGQIPLSHLQALLALIREGRLPPLSRLMSVRLPSDFARELPRISPSEAYALSWTLFHFCMQPEYRPRFTQYLRMLQDPGDIERLVREPRVDILADALGLASAGELEDRWHEHLTSF